LNLNYEPKQPCVQIKENSNSAVDFSPDAPELSIKYISKGIGEMDTPSNPAADLRVTAALISVGGRLFIAQRPPMKKFGLQWEFPGGKVEPGEGLRDSLIREIKEELCWEISVGKLFRCLRYSYPDFNIELYAYWCAIKEGRLCLKEHIAYRWTCLEELRRFDFTTADRQLIDHLEGLSELP